MRMIRSPSADVVSSSYSSTFWLPSGGNNSSSDRNLPSSSEYELSGYDQVVESYPGRNECLKLLRDLNRQVSAYHHLATALGSSGDGQHLRCQLKRTRRRARELASILRNLLPVEQLEGEVGRLWCMLYCCLYVLGLEMTRTLQLEQTFALHSLPMGFINTGLHEFQIIRYKDGYRQHHHYQNHHHQYHQQQHSSSGEYEIPLVDRLSLERAEMSQLQKEIHELESALLELKRVVDIESYLVIPNPLEPSSDYEDSSYLPSQTDEESEEIGSSQNDEDTGVKNRKCLCMIMAGIIFIFGAATILGIFLMIFS